MWHNNKTLISVGCGSIPLLNGEPCFEAISILGIVSAMLIVALISIGIIAYRCFKRSKLIEVKLGKFLTCHFVLCCFSSTKELGYNKDKLYGSELLFDIAVRSL